MQKLHKLALCHFLLAASVLLYRRWPCLAALCWLGVGFGGIGAGWGRWTERNGRWLDLGGAWPVEPSGARCMAEHAPFAAVGGWALWRHLRRNTHAARG